MKQLLISAGLAMVTGILCQCKKAESDPSPSEESASGNYCVTITDDDNDVETYYKYEDNRLTYWENKRMNGVLKAEYTYTNGVLSKSTFNDHGSIITKNYTIQNGKITGFTTGSNTYPHGIYYYDGDFVSAQVIKRNSSDIDSVVFTRNSAGFVIFSKRYSDGESIEQTSYTVDSYGQKTYEKVESLNSAGDVIYTHITKYSYHDIKSPVQGTQIGILGFDPAEHNLIYLYDTVEIPELEYTGVHEVTMDGDKVSTVNLKEYNSGSYKDADLQVYSYDCR